MDEGMKFFYNRILHLDVDKCIELENSDPNLEMIVDGKKARLDDFLKAHLKLVSMDLVSSKKLVQDYFKKYGMPKAFDGKYVDVYYQWAVIDVDKKNVGYAQTMLVENNLTHMLNMEKLFDDPTRTIEEMLGWFVADKSREVFLTPTILSHGSSKLFFTPEFYVMHFKEKWN